MSDSYYCGEKGHGGAGSSSSYSCMRCDRKFKTAMDLKSHNSRPFECALRGRGSRSSRARHDPEFADLSPVESLPSLSGSEGRSGSGGGNDLRSDRDRRRGGSNKDSDTKGIGRQNRDRGIISGPKKDTEVVPIYTCPHCRKIFEHEGGLYRHMRYVHSGRMLQCDTCKLVFWKSESLERHKLELHSNSRTPRCPTCGKTYTRRGTLKRHIMEVHEGGGRYLCKKCGEVFPINSKLSSHYAKVHDRGAAFDCAICSETFPSRVGVKRHIRLVHRKKTTSSHDFRIRKP